MNIVLSAFSPFGDYAANSSEIVAEELHRKTLGGLYVNSMVFPASIPEKGENRGAQLLYAACSVRAVGIIALGMASEKTGLCVERVASNQVCNAKYCPPEHNGRPINPERPYGEKARIALGRWNVDSFRSACRLDGIPVMDDSYDAGGFCCNHLAYQTATARPRMQSWMRIPFIFIHVPCSPEAVVNQAAFWANGKAVMPVEEIIAGLEVLVSKAFLS